MKRLDIINKQIRPKIQADRTQWFKQQGWGYNDTEFVLDQDGVVYLSGKRYSAAGEPLPKFREWAETVCGINIDEATPKQKSVTAQAPLINQAFVDELKGRVDEISFNDKQRIYHSHGHTMQDIYKLRNTSFKRLVDAVVWVKSHKMCENLVELAVKHNVVLIPFGGGTNVTHALSPPDEEKRMIVSVDMSRMNTILWVDRKNMKACIEAGIVGKDLDNELQKLGLLMGHEPDSVEFSTLGGWVSTRASGMKKNRYGNIDDIVQSMRIVTPTGTLTKRQDVPRMSSGPDLNEFVLGSEGIFGIITDVVVRVRPVPEKVIFDSIIFHDFEIGIDFMYEVAQSKLWPASLRLMDNQQFKFGMALKIPPKSRTHEYIDKAKKYLVTDIMKFDPDKMALATIVYEGSANEVAMQQKSVNSIAKKFRGFRAGPENGERGYFLTFTIAYLRDFGLQYGFIAESFETAVPWKNVSQLCRNVHKRIRDECKRRGIAKEPFYSARVTQVYDTGACVYIYFGFLIKGQTDPLRAYEEIEDAAREEVMKNGGSISHHHGVGKLRKKFMHDSVGKLGVEVIRAVKQQLDPQNIFASGNLV